MFIGVNISYYPWGEDRFLKMVKLLKDLKIKYVGGIGFCWHDIEKEKGRYDFDKIDYIIEIFEDFTLFANIGTFPCWANGVGQKEKEFLKSKGFTYFDGLVGMQEEFLPDYFCFVETIVQRYSDVVKYWQIWNEPFGMGWMSLEVDENNWRFGNCREIYKKVIKGSYEIIKQRQDNVVLSGSLDYGDWHLQNMYEDNSKYFDAFSLHLYPRQEGELYNVSLLDASLSYDKDIFITEFSIPVGGNGVTEEEQAGRIVKVFDSISRYDKVKGLFYHTLTDFTPECVDGIGFGLVDLNFNKRKSYYAVKEYLK